MNVAITRAKGLLIVIGNADTLEKNDDCDWREFINFCKSKGNFYESQKPFTQSFCE